MSDIPKFKIYGENKQDILNTIQPKLPLRKWSDLGSNEKKIAFQHIDNSGWLKDYDNQILNSIEDLNFHFLRICPGKNLHIIKPEGGNYQSGSNIHERKKAAFKDFQNIFINESNDAIVLRMLSTFILGYLDPFNYKNANQEANKEKREEFIDKAFEKIDRCCNCFNHVFDQFCVNIYVSRNGIIPKEDGIIIENIVKPTLEALSDPKWLEVSNDLTGVFECFQEGKFDETITRLHSTVQRFLQIQLGEKEGKNGQGELSTLFAKFKNLRLSGTKELVDAIEKGLQSFISNSRAKNSTAKPALKEATSLDAILMLNVSLVLFQHILQSTNNDT